MRDIGHERLAAVRQLCRCPRTRARGSDLIALAHEETDEEPLRRLRNVFNLPVEDGMKMLHRYLTQPHYRRTAEAMQARLRALSDISTTVRAVESLVCQAPSPP